MGHYDDYACAYALRSTDSYIRRIWEWVQSDPAYRDRTTLIVTADHGRGAASPDLWRTHGTPGYKPVKPGEVDPTEGDQYSWLAVIGPDTSALGLRRDRRSTAWRAISGGPGRSASEPADFRPDRRALVHQWRRCSRMPGLQTWLLGQSPSAICREIARDGGLRAYRAMRADKRAWEQALRPKRCRLALHGHLRWRVALKLALEWSPQQIAGWLKRQYPDDPGMQISREAIYRRQYLPRGTDLPRLSQSQLNAIALRLNQRPRKTLGFETPADKLQAVLR